MLVVSTPRPEKPSDLAQSRQSSWPWIAKYEASGVCRHVYARVERGAVAVFDVESKEALHRILNEWADIILRASICWWISRQQTDARGAGSSEEVLSCGSGNIF
jgi:hypothetical protein